MRIVLIATVAAFCMLGAVTASVAGSYQGNGAYSGSPSSAVTALFAAYPNGGDGLAAALRELVINTPDLADDVAYVATKGNVGQQTAAGVALAQAFITLINRGQVAGATRIISAARLSGNSVIQTVVDTASSSTVGLNTFQNSNPDTSTNCTESVSPSKPGSTTCQ